MTASGFGQSQRDSGLDDDAGSRLIVSLLEKGRYKEIVDYYDQHDAESSELGQFGIGSMILEGHETGMLEDTGPYTTERATRLIRRAAFKGLSQAAQEVGEWYEKGKYGNPRNEKKARFWLKVSRTPNLSEERILRDAARVGERPTSK